MYDITVDLLSGNGEDNLVHSQVISVQPVSPSLIVWSGRYFKLSHEVLQDGKRRHQYQEIIPYVIPVSTKA